MNWRNEFRRYSWEYNLTDWHRYYAVNKKWIRIQIYSLWYLKYHKSEQRKYNDYIQKNAFNGHQKIKDQMKIFFEIKNKHFFSFPLDISCLPFTFFTQSNTSCDIKTKDVLNIKLKQFLISCPQINKERVIERSILIENQTNFYRVRCISSFRMNPITTETVYFVNPTLGVINIVL